jgi:hypothetical protein
MFLWFLGTAIISVWYVFRDPRFDYRLLLLGALLPDLIDVPFSRARWAHSLTVAVAVLVMVMLLTTGRKPIRRALLGLPIGMLLHLVWDGAFAATRVFWWPFAGSWRQAQVPSLERGVVLNLAMEFAGAGLLWWAVQRFGLTDPVRGRRFLSSGLLEETPPRDV